MMHARTRVLLAVLAAVTAPAGMAGEPNSTQCPESDFPPVRGFCSADYLGFDVLWEEERQAREQAFRHYFTLDMDAEGPDIQILHDEEPSRGRDWRGEFMIRIFGVRRDMLRAEFWRARQPLQVQLHQLLHERIYGRIADAFAKTGLRPDSDEWAAQIRAMIPPQDQLVNEIQIERFTTSGGECPALSGWIDKLRALTLPAPLHASGMEGVMLLSFHPEWYEVVINSYPRQIHVRDQDELNPYFAWAEETVGALAPCWKPGVGG